MKIGLDEQLNAAGSRDRFGGLDGATHRGADNDNRPLRRKDGTDRLSLLTSPLAQPDIGLGAVKEMGAGRLRVSEKEDARWFLPRGSWSRCCRVIRAIHRFDNQPRMDTGVWSGFLDPRLITA